MKLNSFQLKIFAMVLMVLDHLVTYIPNMPVWFSWVGRIGAPIFFFFISRMYVYDIEKQSNSILLYFTFFIGTILYLDAVNFMSYKSYVELKQEENKYANMISLGLTFRELKKIISREMIVIFLLLLFYIQPDIDKPF